MTAPQARILAIDDAPANLLTLGALLEPEFELQFATSGPMGIAQALASPPDLILLDVMMPEVDGYETFRRLAAQPTLKDIPVIFVTALNDFDSEVTGLRLGAADYITKPIQVTVASQRIRNLLDREQLRKELQQQRNLLQEEVAMRKQSEDMLRKLVVAVEQSPASVVITDLEARLEYVNPRFTEVTGYSSAEVLGQNPRILQSGMTPKETHADMWGTLTRGLPWKGELVNRRKNGALYWEEAQIAPVKNDAGGVTHFIAVKTDITERKQLEMQRKQAEAVFHGLFEQSTFLAGILDEQGRMLDVNSTALRYTDATREEVLGQYFPDTPWWRNPQDRAKLIDVLEQAYAGQTSTCEVSHPLPAGGTIDVLFSATPIRLESHTRLAVVGVDITERKSAEERLRLAASVFTHSREGITIADAHGLIVDVNEAFCRITGFSRAEVLGRNPRILKSDRQSPAFYTSMWDDLRDKGYWAGEIWNRRKNGEAYTEMLTISVLRDDQGITQQYVALFSDISERKAMEEKVRQLAFYDDLTELPNRRLLNDRLCQTMLASKRSELYSAVMFLDLDNFKPLNDAHGHGIGDLLLQEVAKRLKACVRAVDTVARFGGDEFVVLLSELNANKAESTTQAGIVAEKIRTSLSEPYLLAVPQPRGKADNVVKHHCSASIGVVIFVNDDASQDEILKWADAAMYQAKEAGRNLIQFFE